MAHWTDAALWQVYDVGGRLVWCAVAQTAQERAQGAQGLVLSAGEGLAFPFERAAHRTFWMPATCPQPLRLSFFREGALVAEAIGRPGEHRRHSAYADLVIEEPLVPLTAP